MKKKTNLVEVEGRVEKQEGELKSNKSFCRRFNLPGVVNLDTITSAISSDGVLTIRAPKTSGDASVRTASREERTLHRQDTSEASSEGRDGYTPASHNSSGD
ncbi:protein lethal(2)essential for life-like [Homarus americanus]|uniref:protein lethal(2)essential for life-like n=1 Tax=Homarus americanus TaxID=6706 RepID=UPI001C47F4D1|nr:protein lethal(2)essential for life-like [Homarus americanus]